MLLRWQQLHFLQSVETPFTTPEWKAKLDDPDFHEDVISGNYVPPDDLPQEAKDLFKHMKRSEKIKDLPFTSTYEDFKSFIKNSKKTKACLRLDGRTATIRHCCRVTRNTSQQYILSLNYVPLTRLS